MLALQLGATLDTDKRATPIVAEIALPKRGMGIGLVGNRTTGTTIPDPTEDIIAIRDNLRHDDIVIIIARLMRTTKAIVSNEREAMRAHGHIGLGGDDWMGAEARVIEGVAGVGGFAHHLMNGDESETDKAAGTVVVALVDGSDALSTTVDGGGIGGAVKVCKAS